MWPSKYVVAQLVSPSLIIYYMATLSYNNYYINDYKKITILIYEITITHC
jgi:hypothetical protein